MTRARVTIPEIEEAAKRCGLELTELELAAYARELAMGLASLEPLLGLDVADVEPTACVLFTRGNRCREDQPRQSLPSQKVLALAPRAQDGFFLVPPVAREGE